jgi:hypothetical protein
VEDLAHKLPNVIPIKPLTIKGITMIAESANFWIQKKTAAI